MGSIKPILLITLPALLLISLVPISQCRKRQAHGFTTDLIHRDSPESPYHDPTLSPEQRLVNAIRRSLARAHHLDSKRARLLHSPTAELFPAGGEYLLNYSIGTPPVPNIGIADTGSDITWNQCQPCTECFNQSLPIFDPRKSHTYKTIPCGNPRCKALGSPTCRKESRRPSSCHYSQMYGDGSYTEGDLSTDTVTLASSGGTAVSVPGVVVGCGHRNAGIFSGVESGIVGLGGGKASLVGQLGRLAGGRFSYCLASEKSRSSSRLSFGADAEVRGPRAVRTPLVRQGIDTFYYLTMLGISVGSRRLAFSEGSSSSSVGGNIIIDTGTTVTLLPGSLYEGLKKTLQGMVRLRQIPDPTGTLDLCFETRGSVVGLPEVTVHFEGADVKWGQENLFARTGDVSLCLLALPALGIPIYGNMAQTNFLVGYNLRKGMLSFKPVRCGGKP
ncbi:eukaryotic aspartyl protease family protein [Striga asiatica]|uniref:Eukaryotic aspartyl protease family protein n=1 Tax=Striga asiatica TaxID=4170 RepID=A0A5A7QTZ7_STRAF|nr:eukaryotic aspartyl protease family protein [Striga asiatica]